MAGSLNQVSLIGNLGKDPEIRNTQGGDTVANFSVATTESWGKGDDRKEKTEWHNVVVWGPLAGVVERFCSKGSKVFVQGKLTTRKWQDKDGNDRYTTEVVVSGFGGQLVLLTPKGEGGGGARQRDDEPRQQRRQTEQRKPPVDDDDIPF